MVRKGERRIIQVHSKYTHLFGIIDVASSSISLFKSKIVFELIWRTQALNLSDLLVPFYL